MNGNIEELTAHSFCTGKGRKYLNWDWTVAYESCAKDMHSETMNINGAILKQRLKVR